MKKITTATDEQLEADNERLREALRQQTAQTQATAQQKHDAVVATIVRHLGTPDYVNLQEHPIEQIVGTVLSKIEAGNERLREALQTLVDFSVDDPHYREQAAAARRAAHELLLEEETP